MKFRKTLRSSSNLRRAPSDWARRQALLAATAFDERHEYWALEFFERREAVARWRGMPGCTIREVIQAINAAGLVTATDVGNYRGNLRSR
jgi:hypothetical protein